MTLLDLHMKLFGWFYRWRTRVDTLNKMKIRTKNEILTKKKEFEQKLLLNEKQNTEEKMKYLHYLDVIRWLLKEI